MTILCYTTTEIQPGKESHRERPPCSFLTWW